MISPIELREYVVDSALPDRVKNRLNKIIEVEQLRDIKSLEAIVRYITQSELSLFYSETFELTVKEELEGIFRGKNGPPEPQEALEDRLFRILEYYLKQEIAQKASRAWGYARLSAHHHDAPFLLTSQYRV